MTDNVGLLVASIDVLTDDLSTDVGLYLGDDAPILVLSAELAADVAADLLEALRRSEPSSTTPAKWVRP